MAPVGRLCRNVVGGHGRQFSLTYDTKLVHFSCLGRQSLVCADEVEDQQLDAARLDNSEPDAHGLNMNLEQVASSTAGGPTCSLSSLLTFGCRSRAESLAHKLQNKLWSSLGSSDEQDDHLSQVQDPRQSWVAVEARVGLGSETVVTTIPLVVSRHTASNQMLVATSLVLAEQATTMENAKNVDLDAWINSLSSYRALVSDPEADSARDSADSVTSESSSNSGQGGRVSDSDQYFDFGIETPELSVSGDEDESTIIINHDDGLPSQPESGCIFGSPVPSSDEDEFHQDQRAFYDQYGADASALERYANCQKVDATLVAADEFSDSETGDDGEDDSSGSSTECALSRTASPPPRCAGCQVASAHESARSGLDSAQGETEDGRRSARGSPLLWPNPDAADVAGQLPEQQATENPDATPHRSSISSTSIESCTCVPSTSSSDVMVVHLQNPIGQVVNVRTSDNCSLNCCSSDCPCDQLDAADSGKRLIDPACCYHKADIEIVIDDEAAHEGGHVGHDLCHKDGSADRCAELDDANLHASGGVEPRDSALDDQGSIPDPPAVHEVKQVLDIPRPKNSSDDESKDDDDDRVTHIRRVGRSTSLKTGKTPPGTPGHKKIVRFADALGLDLEAVRTFLDEIPNVPQSAFDDLSGVEEDGNSSDTRINRIGGYNGSAYQHRPPFTAATPSGFRTLVASFSQPYTLTGFIDRVKNQKVCLETASMVEEMIIRGVVRVLNIDFHKSVMVRFSTDDWKTFSDVPATYVPASCDGLSDRFNFALFAYRLQPGQRLLFALCYRVAGQEFWDSNQGTNYVFQCISTSNRMTSSIALDSPTTDRFLPYM